MCLKITATNTTSGASPLQLTQPHHTCKKIALSMIVTGSLTAVSGVAAGGGSLATTTAVILTSVGAGVGVAGVALAAVVYHRLRTFSQQTASSQTKALEQPHDTPLISVTGTSSVSEILYLNFRNEDSIIEWLKSLVNRYAVPPLNEKSTIAYELLKLANHASLIPFARTIYHNPLQHRNEVEVSLKQLIADIFSSDSGAAQVQEHRWNTLVGMLKDGLDRLSPQVPCVTLHEFLIAHQLADSSLDLTSAESKYVWRFPLHQPMVNFIHKDRDIDVVGPGSWNSNGLLDSVFCGANNENFVILGNCCELLAAQESELTQDQLNSLLDPFVWAATACDPKKARDVKLALMCFFADHECLCKHDESCV